MSEAEALQRKKVRAGDRASAYRYSRPVDTDRLTILKLALEEKLKTLKADIVGLVAEGDLEAEIQQADEYQERIFEALVRIDRALEPVATPIVTPPTTSSPTDEVAKRPLPTRPHARVAKVKLPVTFLTVT